MTTKALRMLLVAGAVLVAGEAMASDVTADRTLLAGQKQNVTDQKTDAKKEKADTKVRDCICSTGEPGLRLAPIGTNPEVDRLRNQPG